MPNATGDPWPEVKDWCIVYGVEAFVMVVSNAITALVIISNQFLHRRFFYLLLSLAVADFLVGAVACPTYIYVLWAYYSPEGKESGMDPKIRDAQTMLEIFTSYASIYALVVIAMERLVAVMSPWFHHNEARISYIAAILITWLSALCTSLLHLVKYTDSTHYERVFVVLMVLITISLLIVFVCYTIISIKLCTMPSEAITNRMKAEHRIALTLLVASVLFIALWLPFQVANYLHFYDRETFNQTTHHFLYSSKFLHYFNSIINPFIYALMMKDFRRGLKSLCCYNKELEKPQGSGHVKPVGEPMGNEGYVHDDVTMTNI